MLVQVMRPLHVVQRCVEDMGYCGHAFCDFLGIDDAPIHRRLENEAVDEVNRVFDEAPLHGTVVEHYAVEPAEILVEETVVTPQTNFEVAEQVD